ncbi:MAG: haloalkane dehalogenase [Myxococcales bacterium]|jgi:haloalkane dehalogenase
MEETVQAYPLRTARIRGLDMTYVDVGQGDPIVFLHGNPTSSHLWREIIPHVADLGRCIAPDLIGMGHSDKLPDSGPGSYRFIDHRRYLDLLLDALDVRERVTLVVHDWGSALGFDWARRHASAMRGIAYMEALVRPLTWQEWPENARDIFRALRSDAGEEMILDKNLFVEAILPAAIQRQLDPRELRAYRYPFADPGEGRRPTLTWPREIPIDGEPADVVEIVQAYADWLSHSDVPKLFVNADPGSILVGAQREFCRAWPNQTEVTVPGLHFIQEDSPHLIGEALRDWLGAVIDGS